MHPATRIKVRCTRHLIESPCVKAEGPEVIPALALLPVPRVADSKMVSPFPSPLGIPSDQRRMALHESAVSRLL